jgi:hypothetical protein
MGFDHVGEHHYSITTYVCFSCWNKILKCHIWIIQKCILTKTNRSVHHYTLSEFLPAGVVGRCPRGAAITSTGDHPRLTSTTSRTKARVATSHTLTRRRRHPLWNSMVMCTTKTNIYVREIYPKLQCIYRTAMGNIVVWRYHRQELIRWR